MREVYRNNIPQCGIDHAIEELDQFSSKAKYAQTTYARKAHPQTVTFAGESIVQQLTSGVPQLQLQLQLYARTHLIADLVVPLLLAELVEALVKVLASRQ